MRFDIGGMWSLVKESALAFIEDNALSHGAAMAFYAATSLAPILLIVVAVAGTVFGHEAAQLAMAAQISGLMGEQSADLLEAILESAAASGNGTLATLVGLVALVLTASGVFGEMQTGAQDSSATTNPELAAQLSLCRYVAWMPASRRILASIRKPSASNRSPAR